MTMPGSSGTCASYAATASSALRFGSSTACASMPRAASPSTHGRIEAAVPDAPWPRYTRITHRTVPHRTPPLVPPPHAGSPPGPWSRHARVRTVDACLLPDASGGCPPRTDARAPWAPSCSRCSSAPPSPCRSRPWIPRPAWRPRPRPPSRRPRRRRHRPRRRRPPRPRRLASASPGASPSREPRSHADRVAHALAVAHPIAYPDALAHPDALTHLARDGLADVRDDARHDDHVLRPRLGPRRGPQPVRREGPGARRPDGGADPRRVLQGRQAGDRQPDPERPGARPRRLQRGQVRPARHPRARDRVEGRRHREDVPGRRRAEALPLDVDRRRRRDDHLAPPRLRGRRDDAPPQRGGLRQRRRPADLDLDAPPARLAALELRHVSRAAQGQAAAELRDRHQPRRAGPLPPGRRPGRDVARLARRGPPCADRRRPLVRRPAAPPGRGQLRRLRRHPVAGLPRRRGGAEQHQLDHPPLPGPGDRGQRHDRQRVLLRDRRRLDREQRVRVRVVERRRRVRGRRTCGASPTVARTARRGTPAHRAGRGRRAASPARS